MLVSFCLTDRGNAANEDFVRVGPSYGVVVDGATGLVGEPLFRGRFATNAQWLSHVAGESTCAALEGGAPTEEALRRAVHRAREELEDAAGCPLDRVSPDEVPSATLSLAVVREETVELYGLGDSPIVALMRDGSLLVSTDERLEALDAAAIGASRERARGRSLTGPERRALVDDVLLANRRLRNTEGGYWTLDPTGAGLAHLRRLSLPRREVVAVAGMSDGMWRAFSSFGVADPARELASLTAARARDILARLRSLERADPDFARFPRLKGSDDASVFWIGMP